MQINYKKASVKYDSSSRVTAVPQLLTLGDSVLPQVTSVKLFGVHITSDMKWEEQVKAMTKKASPRLHMLRLVKRHGATTLRLHVIFQCNTLPVLECGTPLSNGGLAKKQSDLLDMIQNHLMSTIYAKEYVEYHSALPLARRRSKLCNIYCAGFPAKNCIKHLLPSVRPHPPGFVRPQEIRNQQFFFVLCAVKSFQ